MTNSKDSVVKALRDKFSVAAQVVSHAAGHPLTFLLAVLVVVVWAITGPLFHYSDTWQLVINTGTTIVTFLMVFLIQNTQNRDTLAFHLKLSELVFAVKGAENSHAALENLSDDELEDLHLVFCERAKHALHTLDTRRSGGNLSAAQVTKAATKKSPRRSSRKQPRAAAHSKRAAGAAAT